MLQVPAIHNESASENSFEMGSLRQLPRTDTPSKLSEASLHDENMEDFQPMALCCLARASRPRIWFIHLVCWPWFERISILVILTNCITLGMYDPFDKNCQTQSCQTLETLETCIYVFFAAEMLVKWIAMGLFGKKGYFADSWNKLDCFIVAAGTFELAYGEGEYLSAVRSIRVLRPLRAINRVPSIRILVMLLLDTLPMLGNVLAICFFIFAIFGIIGVQLWQGLLRNRCFPDGLNQTTMAQFNLSSFYRPSFDDPDYVCSLPRDSGLSHCGSFSYQQASNIDCNTSQDNLSCINWYKYYNICRTSDENIFYGSISFDNIVIATVAIFQIITLEGWTDIMYKIQDAHSFWNWLYFVVLILLGSYFMTNLCLVVITSQFQETKQRETEVMRLSRLRSRVSVSTVSSNFMQQGCYTQILHYLEHLVRRFKRRVLKIEKKNKRRKVNPCLQLRNRNVRSVHHHHHHYHYYHHFVHHPSCQCTNLEHSDSPPTSASLGDHSTGDNDGIKKVDEGPNNDISTAPTKPGESSRDNEVQQEGTKRTLVVPQIQVYAQAATALYTDSATDNNDLVSTATANINVPGGQGSTASILAYSKTADSAVSIAAQATTRSINAACSCAAERREDERFYRTNEDIIDTSDDEDVLGRKTRPAFCSRFREVTKKIVEGASFNRVIMISIFLNTICMAVEHHGQPVKMTNSLAILNVVFTIIFSLEMVAKVTAFGPYGYIKDPFNLFDGIIVIVSLMEVFSANDDKNGISVLRSFRLLRIFKLVRFMPALQRQLRVMIKTLDNVMTFLALLLLFIFTASILGMHLFGAKYTFPDEQGNMVPARANFDSLFWALVTVFQILTQEDWNIVLYDGMRSTSSWAALYFLFLMVIGNYILFNLLVAILVEGFAESENEQQSVNNSVINNHRNNFNEEKPAVLQEPSPIKKAQYLAFSWPNITSKTKEEENVKNTNAGRCSSEPGTPVMKSRKFQRHSSLCVLTIDNLGRNSKENKMSALKYALVPCTSVVDENAHLVSRTMPNGGTSFDATTSTNSSWFTRRKLWSLYIFSPNNRFRKFLVKLHANVWFDRVVLFFILFNCVVMAMEEPALDPTSETAKFIDIMQYIFTAIFTIEMIIKVISLGLIIGSNQAYLKSGWNVVDGILVVFSLVDLTVSLATRNNNGILGVLRVFRAFRTLRPLRVINRAPELKLVVETLLSSLKPIGNVVLIATTFFTIFGILGVQLFSGKFYSCEDLTSSLLVHNKTECLENGGKWSNNEYNFDNLPRALLTLFVFATRDGWVTIMYSGVDTVGIDKQPQRNYSKWNVLYFVSFLLLAGFVVLNMLVGVVVENFHKCRDKLIKDQIKSLEKMPTKSSSNRESFDTEDYESTSATRKCIYYFVTHDYFDFAIAVIICINVLFMTLEHYEQPEKLTSFLKYANYLFTLLFVVEALLKIVALGCKSYFQSRWNCMDMFIVVLSIGGIVLDELATSNFPMNPTIIRVMRVLRITRVLKLLKTAEGIRSLLDTVGKALPQVANLGLLFILLFFIFGSLGMELFGEISCEQVECEGLDEHAHFKNFGYSVLTLFRVSTGDNWNGILKDTINKKQCTREGSMDSCEIIQHIAPMYFAIFVLITQFVLLNVVVAVMMKHLEEAKFLEVQGKFLNHRETVSLKSKTSISGQHHEIPDIHCSSSSGAYDLDVCGAGSSTSNGGNGTANGSCDNLQVITIPINNNVPPSNKQHQESTDTTQPSVAVSASKLNPNGEDDDEEKKLNKEPNITFVTPLKSWSYDDVSGIVKPRKLEIRRPPRSVVHVQNGGVELKAKPGWTTPEQRRKATMNEEEEEEEVVEIHSKPESNKEGERKDPSRDDGKEASKKDGGNERLYDKEGEERSNVAPPVGTPDDLPSSGQPSSAVKTNDNDTVKKASSNKESRDEKGKHDWASPANEEGRQNEGIKHNIKQDPVSQNKEQDRKDDVKKVNNVDNVEPTIITVKPQANIEEHSSETKDDVSMKVEEKLKQSKLQDNNQEKDKLGSKQPHKLKDVPSAKEERTAKIDREQEDKNIEAKNDPKTKDSVENIAKAENVENIPETERSNNEKKDTRLSQISRNETNKKDDATDKTSTADGTTNHQEATPIMVTPSRTRYHGIRLEPLPGNMTKTDLPPTTDA